MPPLSMELRERIILTYEQGNTSIRKVADQFHLSKTTVHDLIVLKRTTGQLMPKPPRGGKPSRLLGTEAQAIAMVGEHPDFTLSEYCERAPSHLDTTPHILPLVSYGVHTSDDPCTTWNTYFAPIYKLVGNQWGQIYAAAVPCIRAGFLIKAALPGLR